jgi:hypothetical protein
MHLQLDLLALSSILQGQDLHFTLPYEPLEELKRKKELTRKQASLRTLFVLIRRTFIKKRKAPLGTQEVYTGITKANPKKNPQHQGPRTQKNQARYKRTQLKTIKPTTRQGTTDLQHMCLSFPTPRAVIRVTIVNGTMQI